MKSTRKIKREARRLFRFCRVDGLLQKERVMAVAQAIRQSAGRDRLAMLGEFRRLVALEEVRRTATVQSATKLSQELHNKVRSDLEELHGKGLMLTFVEQPALIGGMRIKVGNFIYDGSVQGRLADLQSRF